MDPGRLPAVALIPQASSLAYSEWSTPVNLGSSINSPANEQNATLSKDGLSLYFSSNRVTGVLDIWVSRRASLNSDWAPAENLGSPVNSTLADFAPNLSIDGHLLFFASNRDGAGWIGPFLDRRPLLTGGQALIRALPFSIDGSRVSAVVDADALRAPASFTWIAFSEVANQADPNDAAWFPDAAPDGQFATWPQ
jgi:hypothetical protein